MRDDSFLDQFFHINVRGLSTKGTSRNKRFKDKL